MYMFNPCTQLFKHRIVVKLYPVSFPLIHLMPDLFNEKAKEWDKNEMIRLLSTAVGKAVTNNVAFTSGMQVMDFGAGTGLISAHVAPLVEKITAVDISAAMLEKLVAKPELNNKVEAVCQDILQDPLGKKFDVIISAMALHHVEDTDKLIASFSDHLVAGGSIALADLDSEDGSFHPEDVEGVFHHGFDREVLQNKLEQHGFEHVCFMTAHTVTREDKNFPIFLVTARKTA